MANYCEDCKWSKEVSTGPIFRACLHPKSEKNQDWHPAYKMVYRTYDPPDTDPKHFHSCIAQREHECGLEGKYFEQQPDKPRELPGLFKRLINKLRI